MRLRRFQAVIVLLPLSLVRISRSFWRSKLMEHNRGHICHYLGRVLHLRRSSPAIISGDRRRSGSEFVEDTLSLACGLSKSGFLRRGEIVAIAALNSDWYVEWMLAVTYIGGIIAPLNYRWVIPLSLKEARSAAEIVKPVLLVFDESCSSWASPLTNSNSLPSLRLCVLIGGIIPSWLPTSGNVPVLTMDSIRKPSNAIQVHDPTFAPQDIALICFTSGTTERPKGVAIRHTALIIQSLAKIDIVGYGLSSHCPSVPHRRDFFFYSHANGWWLPCFHSKV